ncbi:hypothetical protein F0223_06620 [Vibrio coralliilyticus]|uniref:hypothetical protein n=1 Tax=Vibrio TaxID=662 RepID=UPI0005085057|nr:MULTISPECIES: hypothetical protein [Vibrio]KFI11864.1 hypothetical protein IX95_12575 [Vibrio sp. B183]NOI17903.1 hypothetical protein [Vibrio coralliilyticus]
MITDYAKYLSSELPNYWGEIKTSWKSPESGKYIYLELTSGHPFLKHVEDFVNENISARKVVSPTAENARMHYAYEMKNNPQNSEMIVSRMTRRMKEGKGDVKPPESANISIRSLKIIYNKELLATYKAFLNTNYSLGENSANKIGATKFQSKFQNDTEYTDFCAPVLNRRNGELMLFHGTSPYIGDLIAGGGFRPDLGKKNAKTGCYGMLGQGAYFSDNFSKIMTYSTCPQCGDYRCFCRDNTGRKFSKTALISRVCLGHSKLFPHLIHKAIPFTSARNDFRKVSSDHAKELGYDSVISRGTNNNFWNISSGNNEFMITGASQAYPEIIFDYVIGEDNVSDNNYFINLISDALAKYDGATKFRQSSQSKHAVKTLKNLVTRRESDKLVTAVNYYMSVSIKNSVLASQYGNPLKPGSRLHKMLQTAMVESGAYQDY